MPSKKSRLNNAKLYLILDAAVLDHARLLMVLKETVRFGVDIVQLRDKFSSAKDILLFSKHALKITRHHVPYIINDRVDLAILAKADGVHVGQEDIPVNDARRLMGSKAIIGTSCQTLAHLIAAEKDNVDYIGFGSIFKTLTKPDRNPMDLKLLKQVLSKAKVPVFPIGGINTTNARLIKHAGATRAAVCRDILLAENPGIMVKNFKHALV